MTVAAVRKMVAISDQQVLRALLDKMEPRLRRRFIEIIAWLRARKSVAEIAALVEAGRAAESLSAADLAQAGNAFADAVNAIYQAAAREVAGAITDGTGSLLLYDATNVRAVYAARQLTDEMVRELTAEQVAVVQQAIANGIALGMNPRATAIEIRDSIGLTVRQLDAVDNFRALLMSGSREVLSRELRDRRFDRSITAVANGDRGPLSQAEIDRMVERYRARYLSYRAETIARTETLRSLHEGAEAMWQQAIAASELDPSELRRTWRATHDGRTRSSHYAMDGQEQPFGVAFTSGDGYTLRYPGDPSAPASETANCRCIVVTRMQAAAASEPAPTARAA